MKKIRLNVGELRVESFPVRDQDGLACGTVHAREDSVNCISDPRRTCDPTAFGMYTCDGYGSCDPAYLCQDTRDPNAGC